MNPSIQTKSLACTISVKIRMPKNLSFAISRVRYQLQAELPAGMRARRNVVYYFAETPTAQLYTLIGEVKGPRYEIVALEDDFNVNKSLPIWSGCAIENNHEIRTTLIVDNASPPTDGLFALGYLDTHLNLGLLVARATGRQSGRERGRLRVVGCWRQRGCLQLAPCVPLPARHRRANLPRGDPSSREHVFTAYALALPLGSLFERLFSDRSRRPGGLSALAALARSSCQSSPA